MAGISAVGGFAGKVGIFAVVCENNSVGVAILFHPFAATRAGLARINHTSDGREIAGLKPFDAAADLGDSTDDFVPRHAGVNRSRPLAASGVKIGVAYATKKNLELHIPRARLAAFDGCLSQRTNCVLGCEGESFGHENGPFDIG
jgi:hypothetical protein